MLTPILSYFQKLYAVREKNSAGTILWDYMLENTVGGATNGLPKYFLTKFKHDEKKIEKNSPATLLHISRRKLCLISEAPGIAF